MEKSEARIKAENEFFKLLDTFDKSKFNSTRYKKLFNAMSNKEFKNYMTQILKEEQYITMDIDTFKKDLTLDKIFEKCEKLKIKTHKYVLYRENKDETGKISSITPYPALILYIPIKRLQQMISKKNSAVSNNEKINLLTGCVVGDSKSASINDTQSVGLIANGQTNVLKELLSPRADDDKSKMQMLHLIEEHGEVSLSELDIQPKNKQALATLQVFLRGIGIDVKIS